MKSLNEDSDNKKSRDGFIEATRAVELMSFDEVEGLAETMFKGGMGGRQTGVQSAKVSKFAELVFCGCALHLSSTQKPVQLGSGCRTSLGLHLKGFTPWFVIKQQPVTDNFDSILSR